MRIVIEFAGTPRGKATARKAPNHPRVYPDKKSVLREGALHYAAEKAMAGRPLLIGPLRVNIEQRFPIAASWSKKEKIEAAAGLILPTVKPDWDNVGKLCDGLNYVVWVDDKQIVRGVVTKIYSERPGMTIVIETIEAKATPTRSKERPAPDLFAGAA